MEAIGRARRRRPRKAALAYTLVSSPSRRPILSTFLSMVAWQVISLAHSMGNQPLSPSRSRSPSYQPADESRGLLRQPGMALGPGLQGRPLPAPEERATGEGPQDRMSDTPRWDAIGGGWRAREWGRAGEGVLGTGPAGRDCLFPLREEGRASGEEHGVTEGRGRGTLPVAP